MYYRHDLPYEYPDKCDEHMIEVAHKRDVVLDENYPYLPKSKGYKLLRGIYWLGLNLIVFPLMRLTHGLKIYGKKNLKNQPKIMFKPIKKYLYMNIIPHPKRKATIQKHWIVRI